jgi:UDP-glucose 4,6-dehydratase
LEVARALLKSYKLTEHEAKYITFVRDREFNDRRYHIDNRKLLQLDWKPQIGFEEGLDMTSMFFLCLCVSVSCRCCLWGRLWRCKFD